jgi:hypothetical protein
MTRPRLPLIVAPLIVAPVILALSLGLIACGGGDSTTAIETQTTGQQLIDLKAALDAGVITQREYDAKRRDILRHN